MLQDEALKAVIISSWPSSHVEIAIEFIESGRHALIQKPLLTSALSATRILDAVANSEKNILALPLIETIPSFANLRVLMQTGQLGSVTFARIRTTIPGPDDYYDDVKEFFHESPESEPPYRKADYAYGAGSIADMGPYALSAFYYLFGAGTLSFARHTPSAYDRCTMLVMDIDSVAGIAQGMPFCSIETGWEQVRGREVCAIFGSLATACIESNGDLVLLRKHADETIIRQGKDNRCPWLRWMRKAAGLKRYAPAAKRSFTIPSSPLFGLAMSLATCSLGGPPARG